MNPTTPLSCSLAFMAALMSTPLQTAQATTNVLRAPSIAPGDVIQPAAARTRDVSTTGNPNANAQRLPSALSKEIRLTGSAAEASFGRQTVSFQSNLASSRPLTYTAPDGRMISFRPTFLVLANRLNGRSFVLGEVTNSIGQVLLPDRVVWTNILDSGPALDVEYVYSASGSGSLEQNLILREAIDDLPNGWRSEDVSLEFWTEFFDADTATVEKRRTLLRPGTDRQASVEAEDSTISFGMAKIVAGGRAFSTGAEHESLPMGKEWILVPGNDGKMRRFLIESLDLAAAAQLEKLPKSSRRASIDTQGESRSAL